MGLNQLKAVWLLFLLVWFMIIGCVLGGRKQDVWQPIEPQKTSYVHHIQEPKETLPIIAKWYTGDSKNWEDLAAANPTINPDALIQGNRVFIPNHLLKTRKPMPREFVSKCYKKEKKKVSLKKPSAPPSIIVKEPEFEVFGPK